MDILYQDNRIVVCLKPPGVLSTDEPGGMPALLRAALAAPAAAPAAGCIRTVHRLDAAVGGVMVFARSRMAASILSEQIREHRFKKEYLAIISGTFPEKGALCDWLLRDRYTGLTHSVRAGTPGAKESFLSYRALACKDGKTLVRVALETGRTHQIRVQFASRGHALLGDRKYGLGEPGGIGLWSYRLSFSHPETGEWLTFSHAPEQIPQFSDFMDCIFQANDV